MEMAIAAVVAGGAMQATGSIMAGQEKARSALFEQNQLQIQSQQAKTAADQSEANRRNALVSSLETIQAIRAGRGVGAASPTALAGIGGSIEETERNITAERSNYLTRADVSSRAASLAGTKAKTSLLAGYLGAGEAATGSFLKGYNMVNYPARAT